MEEEEEEDEEEVEVEEDEEEGVVEASVLQNLAPPAPQPTTVLIDPPDDQMDTQVGYHVNCYLELPW